eukprot:365744-Chlamydomonas_euryale.AAC.15
MQAQLMPMQMQRAHAHAQRTHAALHAAGQFIPARAVPWPCLARIAHRLQCMHASNATVA